MKPLPTRHHWIAWGPAITWAAVLFFFSELRGIPSGFERFAVNDKFAHAILYTALGISLAWGRKIGPFKPPHVLLLLAGYAYGAFDEWHQSRVPGRTPDAMDLVADVVGVSLGYLLFHAIWAIFFRRRPEPELVAGTGADTADRPRRQSRHGT